MSPLQLAHFVETDEMAGNQSRACGHRICRMVQS